MAADEGRERVNLMRRRPLGGVTVSLEAGRTVTRLTKLEAVSIAGYTLSFLLVSGARGRQRKGLAGGEKGKERRVEIAMWIGWKVEGCKGEEEVGKLRVREALRAGDQGARTGVRGFMGKAEGLKG